MQVGGFKSTLSHEMFGYSSSVLNWLPPNPVRPVAAQAPTLLLGATRQLVVTATWSNGTTTDVTNVSTYATATCPCVSVSSVGLLKGIAVGSSVASVPSLLALANGNLYVAVADASGTSGIAVIPIGTRGPTQISGFVGLPGTGQPQSLAFTR